MLKCCRETAEAECKVEPACHGRRHLALAQDESLSRIPTELSDGKHYEAEASC